MKSYPSMPWNDAAKITELSAAGAQYLPVPDEWFRGVWEPAPQQVMDAAYTAEQERRRLSGGSGQAMLEAGDDEGEGEGEGDDDDEAATKPKGKRRR
jgi:hypothetical protein